MRCDSDNSGKELIEIHASAGPPPKSRGEVSEAAFLAKASSLGFPVAKPWGDSQPYDFVLDSGHGMLRIQIKSTSCYRGHRYGVAAGGCSRLYTSDDIDFIVAHIVPLDLWYVIPIEAFEGIAMLRFNPRGPGRAKYEKYAEAWCLLASPRRARTAKRPPVLCRSKELSVRCAICPCLTLELLLKRSNKSKSADRTVRPS